MCPLGDRFSCLVNYYHSAPYTNKHTYVGLEHVLIAPFANFTQLQEIANLWVI